ncbi:MAG: 3'(2'),5'-bisphosphate nucleotidase CysQ family protein [Saccharospirillum sp.]
MPNWQDASLLQDLHALLQRAGDAILAIYPQLDLWQLNHKADDSPVTAADLASSRVLVEGLPGIAPAPVLSEEAIVPYRERRTWSHYWLVDPMDGTKEFLGQTDEFVINVAYMVNNEPVFGFLYQPVTRQAWWGGSQYGAWTGVPGASERAITAGKAGKHLLALGSRRNRWQGQWRARLVAAGHQVDTRSVGSALKFMHLAEGKAQLYPRPGPTSEWDTAAPQAILQAAGGALVQWHGEPLRYGKEDLLNPSFIAVSDPALLAWVVERGA